MSRQVRVISDGFNVVIDVRINVWACLLVIRSTLYDMKKMWNNTTRCTPLPVIIEIEPPRV